VSKPTSTFLSIFSGKEASSFFNPTGLNFAAQPQVFAKLVSVGC